MVPYDGASNPFRDIKSPRRWVTLSCRPRITRITSNITSDKGKMEKKNISFASYTFVTCRSFAATLQCSPFAFLRFTNTRPVYAHRVSLCIIQILRDVHRKHVRISLSSFEIRSSSFFRDSISLLLWMRADLSVRFFSRNFIIVLYKRVASCHDFD